MRPEILDKMNRFREKALAGGVPSAEVERWLEAARPCATLASTVDGPVVGHFGGPDLLPAGAPPLPAGLNLIAILDLAALPDDATTLVLPADGRLLFFARLHPDDLDASGRVMYVPAGTPLEERPGSDGHDRAELRLTYDLSLPDNEVLIDPVEHPHAGELRRAWSDVLYEDGCHRDRTHLQLDGYSRDSYGEDDPITASAAMAARRAGKPEGRRAGPWARPRPDDWALLAQWYGGVLDFGGLRIGGDVFWTIARKDVQARRFDQVTVLGCFAGP
ncbi:DUF1963 domain-containing protein [Streptomyces sp. NPDC053780]|uniref:DUF1963 domain-containing protein n=1 Tax=unclassified Streptomyces TaxID=2593676 RepID=UPI00341476A6